MSLTTIDTDNYAEMAKAMGISGEAQKSSKSKSTLARLKINHSPIMGMAEVNKKKVNVKLLREEPTSWNFLTQSRPTILLKLVFAHTCNALCISVLSRA
tara:strand:- start:489 stop:785 length:297 start_codon:yes stop_codon:yes gene_type:complete